MVPNPSSMKSLKKHLTSFWAHCKFIFNFNLIFIVHQDGRSHPKDYQTAVCFMHGDHDRSPSPHRDGLRPRAGDGPRRGGGVRPPAPTPLQPQQPPQLPRR